MSRVVNLVVALELCILVDRSLGEVTVHLVYSSLQLLPQSPGQLEPVQLVFEPLRMT